MSDTSQTATLTFPTLHQAQVFCRAWGRYSKRGYNLGSGAENVEVKVFDITPADKQWVDDYVHQLNANQ